MLFTHALLIALVWAAVFSVVAAALPVGYGRQAGGGWDAILFFFLIVWLATWGLGSWIAPAGPIFWGVPWLGFLFLAFLFFMLLTASAPQQRRSRAIAPIVSPNTPASQKLRDVEESTMLFGISFWILLLVLVAIVAARYAWPQHFV